MTTMVDLQESSGCSRLPWEKWGSKLPNRTRVWCIPEEWDKSASVSRGLGIGKHLSLASVGLSFFCSLLKKIWVFQKPSRYFIDRKISQVYANWNPEVKGAFCHLQSWSPTVHKADRQKCAPTTDMLGFSAGSTTWVKSRLFSMFGLSRPLRVWWRSGRILPWGKAPSGGVFFDQKWSKVTEIGF